MKKRCFLIGIIIFIIGCKVGEKPEQKGEIVNEKKSESALVKKQVDPNIQGRIELSSFENKYENKWAKKPQQFPFSDGDFIKVYKLDCAGECFKSEFRKRMSNGIAISKSEFLDLLNLLRNPKSYNNPTAACFDPKFGLVIYDHENVPMEFLSICLNCNNYRTYPGEIEVNYDNDLLHGFSNPTRKKLRKMFLDWGIDYYGFSELWDDEKEYEAYLGIKEDNVSKPEED